MAEPGEPGPAPRRYRITSVGGCDVYIPLDATPRSVRRLCVAAELAGELSSEEIAELLHRLQHAQAQEAVPHGRHE